MQPDVKIRVLIAEDEPIILHNVAKKAEKAGDWVEVAAMAESGSEALSLLGQIPADILITDIEMPGMNGLELIRLVREQYPQMKIIILSGYSNFEYARTALRYGVSDYLLKPVSQETVTELLEKLGGEILEEHANRRREILSLALNGSAAPTEFPSSLTDGSLYLVYLTLGNYAGHYASPEITKEYCSLWEKFIPGKCLEGFPELSHAWLIDEAYPLCKFLILHSVKKELSLGRLRLVLEQYCTRLFPKIPFLLLLCPQSIPCHEIWDNAKNLRQCALAFSRPFVRESCFSHEIAKRAGSGVMDLTRALGILKNLSAASLLPFTERTLKEIIHNGCPSRILLKFVSEVFASAESVFLSDPSQCRSAAAGICNEFYRCPDEEAFVRMTSECLEEVLTEKGPSLSGKNLCGKITTYIRAHYCTRLSLNDLSEHFGYTASYINRIFKKELGLSPVQYITNLKMEKAKELLSGEKAMDVRDVAAAIGYEDARYFSRVFKNETGVTPTGFCKR